MITVVSGSTDWHAGEQIERRQARAYFNELQRKIAPAITNIRRHSGVLATYPSSPKKVVVGHWPLLRRPVTKRLVCWSLNQWCLLASNGKLYAAVAPYEELSIGEVLYRILTSQWDDAEQMKTVRALHNLAQAT